MSDDNDRVVLWVKAGSDGQRLGGDPVGQQLFMILLLKAQSSLKFDVKTVNEAKPPPEFRAAGLRKAPALQHGDEALSQVDEIIEYIDQVFPIPSLSYDVPEADDATSDLFRAFAFFIKDVNKDPKGLTMELIRVDRFVEASSHRFLTGDSLTHLDCLVAPRLQAIRVATKALKNYEIPINLHALWRYLKNVYSTDVFKKSCPANQEIILYWADRPDTPNLSSQQKSLLYRQKTEFSLEVSTEAINGH